VAPISRRIYQVGGAREITPPWSGWGKKVRLSSQVPKGEDRGHPASPFEFMFQTLVEDHEKADKARNLDSYDFGAGKETLDLFEAIGRVRKCGKI
jgi:hypothetical protein